MSKNPVFPYAVIAALGIFAVIIISFAGVGQREARENPEETEETEDLSVEDIFKNNCASCHGDDMEGDSAPGLTDVGSKYSADEIEDIIINGKDSMPPGQASNEEALELAEWLEGME